LRIVSFQIDERNRCLCGKHPNIDLAAAVWVDHEAVWVDQKSESLYYIDRETLGRWSYQQ